MTCKIKKNVFRLFEGIGKYIQYNKQSKSQHENYIQDMYSIKNVPIHVYYTRRHKCILQKKKKVVMVSKWQDYG